jgi:hypothetical protein
VEVGGNKVGGTGQGRFAHDPRWIRSGGGGSGVAGGCGGSGVFAEYGKVVSLKTTCLEMMTRLVVRSRH